MTPKLKLLRGGKITHPGGGKLPPPGGGGTGGSSRPRQLNPMNDLLWAATSRAYYRHRATSVDVVAERMTRLSLRIMRRHIDVTHATAQQIIYDGRRRNMAYGWMLAHAQKGSGEFCGFVPVLRDCDETGHELFLLDADDIEFVKFGLISSVGTYRSMVRNEAEGLSLLIACLDELGMRAEADEFREFAAECRAFSRRAQEMYTQALALR